MERLTNIEDNIYETNSRKKFDGLLASPSYVDASFNFAYDMTYGKCGYHNPKTFGTNIYRSPLDMFSNVFSGKLCEYAVYDYLINLGVTIKEPDTRVLPKGCWDEMDLSANGAKISIKSSTKNRNVLLLKKEEYDALGNYLYSTNRRYDMPDYYVFTRIDKSPKYLIDSKILKKDMIDKNELYKIINDNAWHVDIPGYIKSKDLTDKIIRDDYLIKKGDVVDGMKAACNFYYVQTGDMRDAEKLAINMLDNENNITERQIEIIEDEARKCGCRDINNACEKILESASMLCDIEDMDDEVLLEIIKLYELDNELNDELNDELDEDMKQDLLDVLEA